MKVLVIEDDRTVGQYVKRGLEEHRIHADLVDDGMEGLRLASGGLYDLLVLDLRLPGMTGLEVLRTLRDRGITTPVLVLTAQDAVDFKVQALRMGADDYVTKPFAFEELLARVEALGRRPKELKSPVLRVADLELDTATREVRRGGRPIELTPKEYAVLEYLMRHAGPGDVPHPHHRVRLGLSLRSGHQHRGRGDQPAAQEGGLRARAQAAAHRARRGVRREGVR